MVAGEVPTPVTLVATLLNQIVLPAGMAEALKVDAMEVGTHRSSSNSSHSRWWRGAFFRLAFAGRTAALSRGRNKRNNDIMDSPQNRLTVGRVDRAGIILPS